MRQIRFDLVQTAYALIWTEGGHGPFAVMSKIELSKFLAAYDERKIKTYVFLSVKGEER